MRRFIPLLSAATVLALFVLCPLRLCLRIRSSTGRAATSSTTFYRRLLQRSLRAGEFPFGTPISLWARLFSPIRKRVVVSAALAAELAACDAADLLERIHPCLDFGAGWLRADAALGSGVAGRGQYRTGVGGERFFRWIAGAYQSDEWCGLVALAAMGVGRAVVM